MAHEIREGDEIIGKNGESFSVKAHSGDKITAMLSTRLTHVRCKTRTFYLKNLECIDPDEGLWQEME